MKPFPDVSRWQGEIDFDVMKTKTDYIIFKASQGGYHDPQILINISEAKRVGLPFGLYHFYDDRISPSVQAETFAAMARDAVELWCDWESTYEGKHNSLRNVVSFMERVEELTGKKVGMYTGYFWFVDNTSPINNASQFKYLEDRPLWLAWYTDDHTAKNIERVKIPKPWVEMEVWQYGTPAIGFSMGAKSREIDMNVRLGNPPTVPDVKSTLDADFGGVRARYNQE